MIVYPYLFLRINNLFHKNILVYFILSIVLLITLTACDGIPFTGSDKTSEAELDKSILEPVYTPAPRTSGSSDLSKMDSGVGGLSLVDNGSRGIVVHGIGSVSVTPDVAILSVGVEVFSASVNEARKQAAKAMDDVMEAAKSEGVLSKDIETTMFSIYPRYNYEEVEVDGKRMGQQVLTGYVVSNTALIKIRNVSKVGEVIDKTSESGGDYSRINGIDFNVDDPSMMMQGLRRQAVEDAVEKANQYALLAGVSLGELISLSEVSAPDPLAQSEGGFGMRAMAAPMTSSISPGESKLRLAVIAKFSIE